MKKVMINSDSRMILHGSGVFTTIRMSGGEPWLWDKHWRRLMDHAERLGIDTSPYSEYMVRRGLDESIPDSDKLKPQKARITITDLRPSPLWGDEQPVVPTNVTFLISPLRTIRRPFRLGVLSHQVNSTSPIAGLKTCNYLDQTMSLGDAASQGMNEAIRLNERGHVTSACMSSVFWLKDDQLFTPALSTGCLPGTTREFVIENMPVTEVHAEIDELIRSEAIFLTSAGLGVVKVDEFDGRTMPGVEHAILSLVPQ